MHLQMELQSQVKPDMAGGPKGPKGFMYETAWVNWMEFGGKYYPFMGV